jgi:signal peptidase complex subunit 3
MRRCRGSTPANYTLKYNLMPFVGILTYGEAARVTEPIEFPLARERVE